MEREQSDKMSTLDKIKQLLNKNQSLIEGALNDKRRYLDILAVVEDEEVHNNFKLQLLKAKRMIEQQLEEESTKLKKKYEETAAMESDRL